MIRSALLHLAVGFALGALLLVQRGLPLHPAVPRLRPAHAELVLAGWTVQLAMGVAFWILPRFRRGPERGDERPAWTAWVLLNLGVLVAAAGGTAADPAVVTLGRGAEALAAAAFALHAWPRVKPFG
jgi:cbb3-type cytochrome oxidase subunit 1